MNGAPRRYPESKLEVLGQFFGKCAAIAVDLLDAMNTGQAVQDWTSVFSLASDSQVGHGRWGAKVNLPGLVGLLPSYRPLSGFKPDG